jgi:hypothetical protein
VLVLGGLAIASLSVALAAWIITQPNGEPLPDPPVTAARPSQSPQPSVQPSPPAPAPGAIESPPENERADREEQLRAVRVTARRQFAAGDRQRALATIKRGLALDANDAEINALVEEMSRAARQAAAEARAAAGRRGRASTAFADAQARERQGESLMRSGDRVAAIEAFWDASSRYNQVADTSRQKASDAPPVAPATPPAGAVEPPVALPGTPTISTAPPLPPEAPRSPAEKPVPAPAPSKPEQTRREPPPDPNAAEMRAIRDTLRRYTEAYQSLRSEAVRQVMPSLTQEQLRGLERDLSNYRSYTVEIRNERIALDGTAATVACEVVRSFETKNGISQTHAVESVFHLRRSAGVWIIERLESR